MVLAYEIKHLNINNKLKEINEKSIKLEQDYTKSLSDKILKLGERRVGILDKKRNFNTKDLKDSGDGEKIKKLDNELKKIGVKIKNLEREKEKNKQSIYRNLINNEDNILDTEIAGTNRNLINIYQINYQN